jgi:RNA polymerase sigma factor (sigma-70 family)
VAEKAPLQRIGEEAQPLMAQFWRVVDPYRSELWAYCRKLTGNPWDAEDLFQDTFLKLFTTLSALSHREQAVHPRAFLFRVATNHWIDLCRKRRVRLEAWTEELADEGDASQSIEVQGAFERLLQFLPPRQAVILVLCDAFQFTGREVAEIIGTTEGAVHAALCRARSTLRALAKVDPRGDGDGAGPERAPDPALVGRYVDCFNRRDFQGIAALLAEHAVYSFTAQGSKEYGKATIMDHSHSPAHERPADLRAVSTILWGRPVVLFFRHSREGQPVALHDVMQIATEEQWIIELQGYYFCPEFMAAAAAELGLPRDSWDWAE